MQGLNWKDSSAMPISREDNRNPSAPAGMLGYFDQGVLAAYRNEPHKYRIESDYFEGSLNVTNEFFAELDKQGKTENTVSIRFGYRTLRDGNLAIVVWLPDLFERSKTHIPRWRAFHLEGPDWTTDQDERFENWVRRYIHGDWDVESGPIYQLEDAMKMINALAIEFVGIPLFKHEIDATLGFPAAENTHRYQDKHKELYGYLIDGLDKECISRIALSLKRNIKIADKKTIEALKELFPSLRDSELFTTATSLVSEQRRLASHSVRPPAENYPAFSQFTKDLSLCLDATKEILALFERHFGVRGEHMHKRHEAKKWLPVIDRAPGSHYSIVQTSQMMGKTVEKVEFGFREELKGVHQSEVLIIYFTDGSIMSLEAGSNIQNLLSDEKRFQPEDFHVDFIVHWVPELPKGVPTGPVSLSPGDDAKT
jgi:hypothetical protein